MGNTPTRTIEITASVSAVIPTGNYENYKPMYSAKVITKCNGDTAQVISDETDLIRDILNLKLSEDYERLRVERILLEFHGVKYNRFNRTQD